MFKEIFQVGFRTWLELITEPVKERPEEKYRKDAEEGRPQAFPTYELPKHIKNFKKCKKC